MRLVGQTRDKYNILLSKLEKGGTRLNKMMQVEQIQELSIMN